MHRSFLFVPADSPRKIAKALGSAADVVIIDLEDAVAVSRKGEARAHLHPTLNQLTFSTKQILIRTNALETPFAQADIETVLEIENIGLVIPKVENLDSLKALDKHLADKNRNVYIQIESALGILNLTDIVKSDVELTGLIFGAEDYVASIRATATESRQEILYARSCMVNAASAVDIAAIDTVYTDFRNGDGLRKDSEVAKQLGFTGKLAIHPNQLDVINSVWMPSEEEVKQAQTMIQAYEAHLAKGSAVFEFEGRMVDDAVVRHARRILQNTSF